MVEDAPNSTATPRVSIIVGVYDDWEALNECLRSVAQQTNAPTFEVIIVDDGSRVGAPKFIDRWTSSYPVTIVVQAHLGISVARNHGGKISRGSLLLFVDADCRLQTNCLAVLGSAITNSPQHHCFQLHLIGDRSGLVGRAEELRLETLQNYMLQPNGCIRYLNTAGFAMRRSRMDVDAGLFDTRALRAEDTLLLANLIKNGELPLFVANATVQHAIPLTLVQCLRKDVRSAYWERKTYGRIAAMGVTIRVSHSQRLSMLLAMWRTSGQPAIGRAAWFVVVARQSLQRALSLLYRWIPI
jgi:glycosyltransferase involved in cell wall biosynthesis